MNEFRRRHRKEGMELQLTAMIDIFTMIVIFLVMGSVIGVAEVAVPEGMKLPKSFSVEGVDTAPQLIIGRDQSVQLRNLSVGYPLSDRLKVTDFSDPNGSAGREQLRVEIEKVTRNPENSGKAQILNILADRNVSYREVFDVIQFFRRAGFESLLFVASGEKKGAAP